MNNKTGYPILDSMIEDIIDTFLWTRENRICINSWLPYELYIKYGNYKEYLTDYSPDGIINYFSLTRIAGVPNQTDVYREDIIRVSIELGKTELSPEEYNSSGEYSSEEIIDFFDSWESAIAISLGVKQRNISRSNSHIKQNKISPRLRYRVLARDGFRCVLCGASAKEADTHLHVDHIIPVSKGGISSIDNLRTLCSECNLGKGNLMIEQEV